MSNHTPLHWLGFVAGGLLAFTAISLLLAISAGHMTQGKAGMFSAAMILLALSVPLFALPFSRRIARNALLAVLCPMTAALLWQVFHSEQARWTHQLAAVAFAALLALRIALTRRRQQPA